jgi:hypothetical protein
MESDSESRKYQTKICRPEKNYFWPAWEWDGSDASRCEVLKGRRFPVLRRGASRRSHAERGNENRSIFALSAWIMDPGFGLAHRKPSWQLVICQEGYLKNAVQV